MTPTQGFGSGYSAETSPALRAPSPTAGLSRNDSSSTVRGERSSSPDGEARKTAVSRVAKDSLSPTTSSTTPDTPNPNNPKGRSIQALLKNLETKSKQELLAIAKKMVSEINVKNRIINETKTNEKWMLAELSVAQDKSSKTKSPSTDLKAKFSRASISPEDKDFLQTLMAFKAELAASKKQVEEHEVSLLILEKKRTKAEEEAAYLRTIVDPKRVDLSTVQGQRIHELETQLNETVQDYTILQSKVSQWARASKRNQEGRISAEAVQKVLEEECAVLKAKLESASTSESSLRLQLNNMTESLRGNPSGDRDLQFVTMQTMLSTSQLQIQELEQTLQETKTALENADRQHDEEVAELSSKRLELTEMVESLRIRNQELEESVGSKNEYQEIIKKRSSRQFMSDARSVLPTSPVGRDTALEREYQFLQDKYSTLEQENSDLKIVEQELRQDLENAEKKFLKLKATLEDQEELLYTIKQTEADKKTLQAAYDTALDKIQQKQLAIEMLQKNMDRARDKMEPLQKTVEDMDDLQDALAEERYAKEELQDKLQQLEADNLAQQQKIITLMERLGNSDTGFELANSGSEAIQELQERVIEYKQMNEMLSLQLEERNQDVEMLEARLGESSTRAVQNAIAEQGYSLSQTARPRTLDDPTTPLEDDADRVDAQKELVKASETLAEQLITIQNLEQIVAEDNEVIERLKAERTKLNQKLSLMQQIKGEYDNQTAEYEKLLASHTQLKLQYSEAGNSESTLHELQSLHENEKQKFLQEIEYQKDLVAQVQEELERLVTEKQDLQMQLSVVQQAMAPGSTLDTLHQKIQLLERQRSEMELENQSLTEQLEESVPLDTESYIARIQQLEDVLTSFAGQKEQMLMQLQSYRAMEEDYREEQAVRQDLENKLAQVDAEVDFMQSEFDQKVQQMLSLQNQIAQLQKSHDEAIRDLQAKHQSVLGEKDDRIERLLDTVQSNDKSLNDFRSQATLALPPKDDLLSKSQDELARLVSQLDAAEVEIEELKGRLEEQGSAPPAVPVKDAALVNEHYQASLHQKELDEKEKEIARLHSELDLMEERMAKVLGDKEALERTIQGPGALSSLQRELEAMNAERDNLWAEMDRLEKGYQNEIEAKDVEILELRRTIEGLQSNPTSGMPPSPADSAEKLKLEIERLRDEKAKMEATQMAESVFKNQEIEVLQSEIETAKEQIYRLQQDATTPVSPSLQTQLAEKSSELDQLRREHDATREKLEALQASSDQLKGSLESQLESKLAAIAKLEDEVASSHQRIQELASTKAESPAADDSKALLHEIDELKLTVQKKTVEASTLAEKANSISKELEALKSENLSLQTKVAEMGRTIDELHGKLEYQHSIADDALKQLDEYEEQILTLRGSASDASQIEALQAKLQQSERELAALRQKAASAAPADSKVNELETMNSQLLGKIASLSQKLAQQDNNRMSINPAMMAQLNIDQHKKELAEVSSQLNDAVLKINSFQREKAELLDELDDLRDHNLILQRNLTELQSRNKMADGKIEKMEKDWSVEVAAALEKTSELARSADLASNTKVLVQIVSLCYQQRDFKLLNENIVLLSKKRALLKQAITTMVQHVAKYVDEIKDMPTKLELIDTLRTTTDGKEKEGKIVEAAELLQELQVETYGSMEKREKTDFILEQFRLCMAKKDYMRAQIISRKISIKFFEDPAQADLKIRFYNLMIQLSLQAGEYLKTCKNFRSLYDTPSIKDNDQQWKEILASVVIFVILAPFDNEQSDLIHRINQEPNLTKIPLFK
ncbi:26S proteasome non-ATPase regulatory subunit 12 [Kappamyces sp. JEL0680]|nr:26S proteasome non-ATPase regulatory subunit 12 [Kappamyces sp. JEL0680]